MVNISIPDEDSFVDSIVKTALTEFCKIKDVCQKNLHPSDDLLAKCSECVREKVKKGAKSDNYSCNSFRHMYVLRYLPVHLNETLFTLRLLVDNQHLPVLNGKIRALIIGRGPGNDVFALVKFINSGHYLSNASSFDVTCVDREKGWDNELLRYFSEHPNKQFVIKSHVCDIFDFLGKSEALYNIFIISYVVSELTPDQCEKLGGLIATHCSDKAIVILNDRRSFDSLIKPLQIIDSKYENNEIPVNYPNVFTRKQLKSIFPKENMTSSRRAFIIRK